MKKVKLNALAIVIACFVVFSCQKEKEIEKEISQNKRENSGEFARLMNINLDEVYNTPIYAFEGFGLCTTYSETKADGSIISWKGRTLTGTDFPQNGYTWNRYYADVTGDGKSDLVFRLGGEIWVAKSNGNKFEAATKWTDWSITRDFRLADISKDGAADLVGREKGAMYVAFSTKTSFSESTIWANWAPDANDDYKLADVNNDQRADIICKTGNTIYVGLAMKYIKAFETKKPWTAWYAHDYNVGYFNNDRYADLIGRNGVDIHVAISTGSNFNPSTIWTSWNSSADYKIGDVNGDGFSDIIGRIGDNVQVGINNGNGFNASTQWTTWNTLADYQISNVDGLKGTDIVGSMREGIHVGHSNASSGTNSFAASNEWWSSNSPISTYISYVNTDILKQSIEGICYKDQNKTHCHRVVYQYKEYRASGIYFPDQVQNIVDKGNYIADVLESYGYTITREPVFYNFPDENGNIKEYYCGDNIIATKTGKINPNSFIEFTGHYDGGWDRTGWNEAGWWDDYGFTHDNLGALDNASAIASLLESARILSGYDNKNSIRFIALTLEETDKEKTGGLTHVKEIIKNREKIITALNVDVAGTGFNGANNILKLWYRCSASYELTKLFNSVCKSYGIGIDLTVKAVDINEYCQSDELSYRFYDMMAITSLGDVWNSGYHSNLDNPDRVDYNNLKWITQANIAVALTLDSY